MSRTALKKKAATPAPDPYGFLARGWGPVEILDDVEQGSDEWLALRLGIPTASLFSVVLAEGKDGESAATREDLLDRLAGEILSGRPGEFTAKRIKTAAMERGTEMEPRAREYFERTNIGPPVTRIGFMRRRLPSGRYVGASPDGVIAMQQALEIKTMAPHLLVRLDRRGLAAMPTQFRAQVHGTMLVGDLPEAVLQLYYDGMPHQPRFGVRRDEQFIHRLANEIEIFDHELNRAVESYRKKAR